MNVVPLTVDTGRETGSANARRMRAEGHLPATVYVRGFVTELAKYLRLDPAQVQRTYLRRMREKHVS